MRPSFVSCLPFWLSILACLCQELLMSAETSRVTKIVRAPILKGSIIFFTFSLELQVNLLDLLDYYLLNLLDYTSSEE